MERFLNACRYRGLRLWGLHVAGNCYKMNISIRDFKKLKPIIRKTGTKVTIVKKFGLPFYLQQRRKRKMFFGGFFVCLILIFLMSQHIWSIEIEGNRTRTDETLTEFLAEKSIHTGMKKSKIDCERIVKDIRKEYDDIIWVSAYIRGTKLFIHVKENGDAPITTANDNEQNAPADIVADADCTIESVTLREGICKVKEGLKVKKGDILVSGLISVVGDDGGTLGYRYCVSDADITGIAKISYEESCPLYDTVREETGIRKQEYFLELWGFRISLGGIKNEYEHLTMKGQKRSAAFLSAASLPVRWGKREVDANRVSRVKYSKTDLQKILSERFLRTSEDLAKKGVEIIENDVKIYTGSKKATARGTLTVRMPIGKRQSSKIPSEEIKNKTEQTGDEKTDGNDGSNH